jgi:hypothetical protein
MISFPKSYLSFPPSLIEGASRRPLPRKSCPRKLSSAALTERMDRVNPAKHTE